MNPEYFSIQYEELGPRLKTYRPGRRCAVCGRPLSVYNSGRKCFCHQPVSCGRVRRVDTNRRRNV